MPESPHPSRLAQEITQAHTSLRGHAQRLRECFDKERMEDEPLADRLRETRTALDDLSGEMTEHFDMEEAQGLVDSIISARPELATRARELPVEHSALRGRFESLCQRAAGCDEGDPSELAALWRDIVGALDALLEHEANETKLLTDTILEDTGGRG